MPYAPGIQDISGQLIAQGMSQAGAARARSLEKLGESISGGIKQYQQNQLFTNQALGKFGMGLQDPQFKQYVDQVVNDDPNAPQVPDAVKKAFKNAATGNVDIYDAALLGNAAEGYAQNKMRAAQAQGMLSEELLRKAQAAKLTQEVERMKAENAFFKGLEEQTQQDVASAVAAVAPVQAPAQAPYFLRRDVTGQAAPSAVPAEAIAAMTPSSAVPAAAMGQVRPSSAITPKDILDARQQLGPGANISQIRMTAQRNVEARSKEFMPEGLFASDKTARQQAAELDRTNPMPGYIRDVEYVPQAKAFVIKPVERKKTATEELESTTAGKLAEMEATQASKNLTTIRDQATNARDDLTRLDRIENAVLSGVRTGFGSDFVTGLTSALVEIGMYPSGKQASKEVLQSDVAKDALTKTKQYMSGQGSVSNAERERVDRVAQNANMQGDALLELVRIQRSVYNRQIAADEHRMALEDKYEKDPLRTLKINKEMDRWWAKNTIGKFEDELKKEQGSTAAATKAGTTEWNYDPKTGHYNPTSKP